MCALVLIALSLAVAAACARQDEVVPMEYPSQGDGGAEAPAPP
jgi:hypothetical protein